MERYPTRIWSTEVADGRCERIDCAADGLTWLSVTPQLEIGEPSSGHWVCADQLFSIRNGPGTRLIAVDADGAVRHSFDGAGLIACLPDGAVLATAPGALLRISRPESPPRRRTVPDQATLIVQPDRIAVALEENRYILLNQELEELSEFTCPAPVPFRAHVDGIYWAKADRILHCDWSGNVAEIARIPIELVCAEIERTYPGFSIDTSNGKELVAEHPERMFWCITPDADDRFLFACNRMYGFTVVCFSRSGQCLWVRCLSRGCCGLRVQRLNSGVFVASSGCGGTVAWFDADGRVLAHSAPRLEPGFGGVLWSDLLIDDTDLAYAQRVDGTVLALDSNGRSRWELQCSHLQKVQLDRRRKRLLCTAGIEVAANTWRSTLHAWDLAPSPD